MADFCETIREFRANRLFRAHRAGPVQQTLLYFRDVAKQGYNVGPTKPFFFCEAQRRRDNNKNKLFAFERGPWGQRGKWETPRQYKILKVQILLSRYFVVIAQFFLRNGFAQNAHFALSVALHCDWCDW